MREKENVRRGDGKKNEGTKEEEREREGGSESQGLLQRMFP